MAGRTEFLAGLRQFADWLDANPDVPAPTSQQLLLPLLTNAAVQEFATTHHLDVAIDEDGNASCDLKFGPTTYHVYGYADFKEWCDLNDERRARSWATEQGMVIRPADEGPVLEACACMPQQKFPCGHCEHDVCLDCHRCCTCRCNQGGSE